jgi:hypothetical protein
MSYFITVAVFGLESDLSSGWCKEGGGGVHQLHIVLVLFILWVKTYQKEKRKPEAGLEVTADTPSLHVHVLSPGHSSELIYSVSGLLF